MGSAVRPRQTPEDQAGGDGCFGPRADLRTRRVKMAGSGSCMTVGLAGIFEEFECLELRLSRFSIEFSEFRHHKDTGARSLLQSA